MKLAILFTLLLCVPLPVQAARDLCDRAARHVAKVTGVPADLLRAITLTETQRDNTAWPWTMNHGGQGYWYPTRDEAAAAAAKIINSGGSADLGCFQINSRWHGDAFPSPDTMLDPMENALYAARFLTRLHQETGDWAAAVAAYHSRDVARGSAYLDRVQRMQAQLMPVSEQSAASAQAPKRNRFPLLLSGDPVTAGSLVPRLAGVSPMLGGP